MYGNLKSLQFQCVGRKIRSVFDKRSPMEKTILKSIKMEKLGGKKVLLKNKL